MVTLLKIGEVAIDVVFKDIRNVHLSVYPPEGRVRIAAPEKMSLDSIRVFAISRIGWIRKQQQKFLAQEREAPREYLERESHYLWGKRYLLTIVEGASRSSVNLGHRTIELTIPQGTTQDKKRLMLDELYRSELRKAASPIIQKWEENLEVRVERLFIQRMKTKWGSSNPSRRTIRLNLELAKHNVDCLNYVILHEIAHFIAPNHKERFVDILSYHLPNWRQIQRNLNAAPLLKI
jgi:predicted metal-dependent hydrolase